VDEPTDASEEPEPIMLEEEDQDDLVAAILDANVGLREADTRRQAPTSLPIQSLLERHLVPAPSSSMALGSLLERHLVPVLPSSMTFQSLLERDLVPAAYSSMASQSVLERQLAPALSSGAACSLCQC